jgi:low affinity Fe/Cu permease
MTQTPVQTEPRESVFDRIADYVSAAMGRPLNIAVWLVLVAGWTVLFASGLVNASGTFLPGWFTSQGFNFPLNLVTTVAELFIGFLVAAAANRSERNLELTLAAIQASEDRDAADMKANTDLTRQVHELASANKSLTEQVHALLRTGTPAPESGSEEDTRGRPGGTRTRNGP